MSQSTKKKGTVFEDLVFKPHPASWMTGVQAVITFSNGYGASVVHDDMLYGCRGGLYKLAIIK
jgi:hypothetical protein